MEGSLSNDVKKEIESFSLKNIQVHGLINNVSKVLNSIHLIVLPSLAEGMSNVL